MLESDTRSLYASIPKCDNLLVAIKLGIAAIGSICHN